MKMEYTEQQKQIYNDVCDKHKHNWLNTTISQAMAMEMISKALTAHVDVWQIEQLKAFANYAQVRMWEDDDKDLNELVEEFLSL